MSPNIEELLKLTETEDGKRKLDAMVEELSGAPKLFYICKRGLYYRPNGHGYTGSRSDAWKLPENEALQHEYKPDGHGAEWVILEPVGTLHYTLKRDDMAEAEKTLNEREQRMYADHLHELALGTRGSFHHCCASPHLRAVAFIQTKKDS